MARRLRVPPTKSMLLTLRRQVDFLEEGYNLLDRKRELLTRLVYERLGSYRELRKQVEASLKEAYAWLGITHMRMGSRMLQQAGMSLNPAIEVKILPPEFADFAPLLRFRKNFIDGCDAVLAEVAKRREFLAARS